MPKIWKVEKSQFGIIPEQLGRKEENIGKEVCKKTHDAKSEGWWWKFPSSQKGKKIRQVQQVRNFFFVRAFSIILYVKSAVFIKDFKSLGQGDHL